MRRNIESANRQQVGPIFARSQPLNNPVQDPPPNNNLILSVDVQLPSNTTPPPSNNIPPPEEEVTQGEQELEPQRSEELEPEELQGSEELEPEELQGSEELEREELQGSEELEREEPQGSEELESKPEGSEELESEPEGTEEELESEERPNTRKRALGQDRTKPIFKKQRVHSECEEDIPVTSSQFQVVVKPLPSQENASSQFQVVVKPLPSQENASSQLEVVAEPSPSRKNASSQLQVMGEPSPSRENASSQLQVMGEPSPSRENASSQLPVVAESSPSRENERERRQPLREWGVYKRQRVLKKRGRRNQRLEDRKRSEDQLDIDNMLHHQHRQLQGQSNSIAEEVDVFIRAVARAEGAISEEDVSS
ncbi:uncharacterized protein LOC9648459 [Selaginella moellendorffii]|uniref:uncharacterized protein LOC9648459 n=1 Tax=Selaginella moellendorffii TaxID=88036 RepID=UPI000D1C7096|nr:uncharacterized protein LOC9648459 [Selaginella moellendorffii]|eukprot:XP_024523644.1 uncharacterized protein LOC9648459 [Selaginella moellendorffii]